MFGFGKSAKLDERERLLQEREQALNAREKALNVREREFNIREKRLKERETAVSQWEREAAEKLKRAHLRKEEGKPVRCWRWPQEPGMPCCRWIPVA